MAFLVDEAFAYLQRSVEAGRLGHAYLITGAAGSGKEALALRMIALLNGVHADRLDAIRSENVYLIRPESRSRRIRVAQVRALEKRLHLSIRAGMKKIGILIDVDRLQTESENAFLKTLEEPPDATLILLLSEQPELLLDTIRSRCIQVPLHKPGSTTQLCRQSREFLDRLTQHFDRDKTTLSQALSLARFFSGLLKSLKEDIAKGHDALYKEEVERYAEVTEGPWLKQREEFYKELATADYLQRRTEILEVILAFFGDALRLQAGYDRLDLTEYADTTRTLAQKLSPNEVNRRFRSIELLREHLQTTAQEILALEVGFIRAFA